jgi:hypothetical protein
VEELDPRHMSKYDTMGVESSLGRTRGAGGVNDQSRIISLCSDRLEVRGPLLNRSPEVEDVFAGLPFDNDDNLQFGELVPDLEDLIDVGPVRNDRFGFAVPQAVFQSIRAEKGKQGDGDSSDLVDGNVRDGGFRTLGQEDPDTVSAIKTMGLQGIGEPV